MVELKLIQLSLTFTGQTTAMLLLFCTSFRDTLVNASKRCDRDTVCHSSHASVTTDHQILMLTTSHAWEAPLPGAVGINVAVTSFRRYKRSDWRFCACAIYVQWPMCIETTKHFGMNTTGCSLGCTLLLSKVICRKLTRGKQVLRHIFIASVNHVTVVRHNTWFIKIKGNILLHWTTF